jgi:YggT family protein
MIWLIQLITYLLTLLILIHVVLSFIVSPYHPVREFIDRIVEPMLMPIRRMMPSTGGLDFSPVILLLLIQLIGRLLIGLLI